MQFVQNMNETPSAMGAQGMHGIHTMAMLDTNSSEDHIGGCATYEHENHLEANTLFWNGCQPQEEVGGPPPL